MRWRGRRQSSNIEDRRSGGFRPGFGRGGMRIPVRAGGGGGIGFIVIVLVIWLVFGINPLQLLDGGMETGGEAPGPGVERTAGETDDFLATVLAYTEDVWSARFRQAGETYPAPTLVLFESQVRSACGIAGAAAGPFYCPSDERLYIDLDFFQKLRNQLNSPGDFAQAYVIAHEVGHHVQNLTGVLGEFNRQRQRMDPANANALSVRVELQADCYAGIWAHDTHEAGYIEAGDIDEALNAASQIGDDTLQRRGQGQIVPDSFTHGTSAQRSEWFSRGYETGDFGACDTFGGNF